MKHQLDDPIIIEGRSGSKWFIKPLPGGGIKVLGVQYDFKEWEQAVLLPGDSINFNFQLEFFGLNHYFNLDRNKRDA